jgi:hypothetical protein
VRGVGVLIAGGGLDAPTDAVELYDEASRSFVSLAPLRHARLAHNAVVLRDGVYDAVGAGSIAAIVVAGGLLAGGIVWTTTSGPIGLIAVIPGAVLLMASIVAVPLAFVAARDAGAQM